MADTIKQEDYSEPRCLLCETDPQSQEAAITRIPTGRVIEKLDSYLGKNDYDAAERHLRHWAQEAKEGGDTRGLYTVYNELMGLCRKLGKEAEAMDFAERTVQLVHELGMEQNVTGATAFLNAGTVYKAFGKAAEGFHFFEQAKAIYEAQLNPDDNRLAGLYNNMALSLVDLGRYDEAETLYQKAFAIMDADDDGMADAAITLLNLANLVEARDGLLDGNEQILGYLDRALALLHDPKLKHDGYYAFVCEKCAPTFGYYGYFADKQELEETARRIYEGT